MFTKACLIFNPTAGQGDPVEELVKIREVLEPKLNLDIIPSHKGISTLELTQQAISKDAQIILIAGGDGTISSAAEALIGIKIPVGIIPRGTVNAFAKALNMPIDIKAACETILSGKPRIVDTAICNGKPMIVLTSIGLEADTIKQTNRKLKNYFGMLAFIIAGIQELRKLKTFKTYIETESKIINCQAVAVTIANTAASTSLLAHSPAGVIADDGLLDVTVFAPRNQKNAFFAAYNLLRSGFTSDATIRDDIQHFRTNYVKVKTEPLQQVSLDGDSIGITNVEINCVPQSLTVLVPA
ncbi:MAG: YegS/Rv2252/BmrU family lipid kinase [Scytonematopsis contorta HA4267-MV1]|jgi:YegS/Rv2252/BmrU family lipid kinase|nr:YegS/Rv2252/BmrU family lipid kinase [Scytonematopsis contorta HA4267-MV1]